MSDRAAYTAEWRRLEQRLLGMEKYVPRNAMRAASTAAFRVIDSENARRVRAAEWKTPDHRPAFRRRAAMKSGYRYKIQQGRNTLTADSAYQKASRYPELYHAFLVERGWKTSKGTTVAGRFLRATAFKTRRRAAQGKMIQALRVALDIATNHPRGYVKVGDVERTVGGWKK